MAWRRGQAYSQDLRDRVRTAKGSNSDVASRFAVNQYSADLDPIEQVFAKLKQLLRRTAMRTVELMWGTIGELLHAFSPSKCSHCIRHCGYSRSA